MICNTTLSRVPTGDKCNEHKFNLYVGMSYLIENDFVTISDKETMLSVTKYNDHKVLTDSLIKTYVDFNSGNLSGGLKPSSFKSLANLCPFRRLHFYTFTSSPNGNVEDLMNPALSYS